MEEEKIKFETAKLAQEKGLILVKGYGCYNQFGKFEPELPFYSDPEQFFEDELYSAPTQSLLQRWLREVHDIHIQILPYNSKYLVSILKTGENGSNPNFNIEYDTYEDALEAGLFEGLQLVPPV